VPSPRDSSHRSRTSRSAPFLTAVLRHFNRAISVDFLFVLRGGMERFGVNASRSHSEVTPSKRWKTASLFSRVVIPQRGNRLSGGTSRRSLRCLKHGHSNPAKPQSSSNKNAGFQGRRVYASLGRCGPTPTGGNSRPWAPAHTGKGAASRRRPLDPRAI